MKIKIAETAGLLLLVVSAFAADPISPPPKPLAPLNKSDTVILDAANKKLVVKAEVVMREGLLEMLACIKRTKEHEAILGIDAKAETIHAGLLALGAEVGEPVQYLPEQKPARGQRIDIFLNWTDDKGKPQRVAAQEWIRHATRRFFIEKLEKLPDDLKLPEDDDLRYDPGNKELLWYGPMNEAQRDLRLKWSQDKNYQALIRGFFEKSRYRQLDSHWIFAGSRFEADPKTGEKYYLAESGDLICVANFPTATLDLDTSSSSLNDSLMFEAWTERVPKVGTAVTIELIPVANPAKKPAGKE